MRKIWSASLAVAMAVAALAAGTVTVSPAHADYGYTLTIQHHGMFVADFCLNTESYDAANRDYRVSCTGRKTQGDYDLLVSTRDGYRVWLDVHVVAGISAIQVTMHNGFQAMVNDHVFNTRGCEALGGTLNWTLYCERDERPKETYWVSYH